MKIILFLIFLLISSNCFAVSTGKLTPLNLSTNSNVCTDGSGNLTTSGCTGGTGSNYWNLGPGNVGINTTTNNVGIGTIAPQSSLTITGGGIAGELVNKGYELIIPNPAGVASNTNEVKCFLIHKGILYIGYYAATGGTVSAQIYKWDGNSVSLVHSFGTGSHFQSIASLGEYQGNIYAGIQGGSAGDGDVYVSTDDGATWTKSYDTSTAQFAYSQAVFKGNLYVGQGYSTGSVEVFNGTTWSQAFAGLSGYGLVTGMYVYAGRLFLALGGSSGSAIVSTPDGVNWTTEITVSHSLATEFNTLQEFNGNLYVDLEGSPNTLYVRNSLHSTWVPLSTTFSGSQCWGISNYNNALYVGCTVTGGAVIYKSYDGVNFTTDFTNNSQGGLGTEAFAMINYEGSLYIGMGFNSSTTADIWRKTDSLGQQSDWWSTFLNKFRQNTNNGYNWTNDASLIEITSPWNFDSQIRTLGGINWQDAALQKSINSTNTNWADSSFGTNTTNYVLTAQAGGLAQWAASSGGSGTPGGTVPQLQYNNAGSFGGIANSGADANGNIGLGTTAPNASLEVIKNGSENYLEATDIAGNPDGNIFTVTSGGAIGIGTATPTSQNSQYDLSLSRNASTGVFAAITNLNTGTTPSVGMDLNTYNTQGTLRQYPTGWTVAPAWAGYTSLIGLAGSGIAFINSGSTNDFRFFNSTTPQMDLNAGNLGIGTTVAPNKLSVVGGGSFGSAANVGIAGPANGLYVQGNVGINSVNPFSALDVEGTLTIGVGTTSNYSVGIGTTNNQGYQLFIDSTNASVAGAVGVMGATPTGGGEIDILNNQLQALEFGQTGSNYGFGPSNVGFIDTSNNTPIYIGVNHNTRTVPAIEVTAGNNIGIGTFQTTTSEPFEMGNHAMDIMLNGNIGVGTVNPIQTIQTTGNMEAAGVIDTAITGSTQCVHANSSGVLSGTGSDCGSSGGSGTVSSGTVNQDAVYTGSTTVGSGLITEVGGNVGIDTTLPAFPLQINGNVGIGTNSANLNGGYLGIGTTTPTGDYRVTISSQVGAGLDLGLQDPSPKGEGELDISNDTGFTGDILELGMTGSASLYGPPRIAFISTATSVPIGIIDNHNVNGLPALEVTPGNNVGIGTNETNTSEPFEVGKGAMDIMLNGNIGVGTVNPIQTIQTKGNMQAAGIIDTAITGSTQCVQANSSGVLSGTGSTCGSGGSTTPGGGQNAVQYNNSSSFSGKENVFSFNGTNVGIGTTNGNNLLDVEGNVTVGIGTTINSTIGIGTTNNQGYQIYVDSSNANVAGAMGVQGANATGGGEIDVLNNQLQSFQFVMTGSNYGFGPSNTAILDTSNSTPIFMGVNHNTHTIPAFEITAGNNVGIGTNEATTSEPFEVGNGKFDVMLNGNLGIGTVNPISPLQLIGIGTLTPNGGILVSSGNVGIGTITTDDTMDIVSGSNIGIGTFTYAKDTFGYNPSTNPYGAKFSVYSAPTKIGAAVDVTCPNTGCGPEEDWTNSQNQNLEIGMGGSSDGVIANTAYFTTDSAVPLIFQNNHNSSLPPAYEINANNTSLFGYNVGIGTPTSGGDLSIVNGNLGIGTNTNSMATNPTLEIIGNIGIGTANPFNAIQITGSGANTSGYGVNITNTSSAGYGDVAVNNSVGNGFLLVATGSGYAIPSTYGILVTTGQKMSFGNQSGSIYQTIDGNGNVGIGTATPEGLLNVAGNCKSSTGDVCMSNGRIGICTAGTFPNCSSCTVC